MDRPDYFVSHAGPARFGATHVPDVLKLFDERRWLDVMHAVLFELGLIGDHAESHRAVCDYGALHELNHLVTLGHTGHRMTMDELRAEVERIHVRAHGT